MFNKYVYNFNFFFDSVGFQNKVQFGLENKLYTSIN